MIYKVVVSKQSTSSLQRCYFSDNILEEHYGRYGIILLSSGNKYFVRICVNPLLQEDVCLLDKTVQCLPKARGISKVETISYESITVFPSVNYIKKVHLCVIFKSAWGIQEWENKINALKLILKQILQLFIHVNETIIKVDKLEFNSIGLHSIIVSSIGNIPAGKIVNSTKIIIDQITCFERYSQLEDKSWNINLAGLNGPFERLKQLFISMQNAVPQNTPTKLISSLKILVIGPDGCGKKTLINRLGFDCKATILTIDGPELSRPQPGETELLLKEKFEYARLLCKEGPCIIMIIRIESFCSKQGRILSQFLYLLDSIPPSLPLVIIGTTSSPNGLHRLIRSSSRFHNRVFISIPNEEERCEMLDNLCGSILPNEKLIKIACKTPGFVIADLELLVKRAKRKISFEKSSQAASFSEEELFNALNETVYLIEPSSVRGELGVVRSHQKLDMTQLGGIVWVKQLLTQSIEWPLLYPEAFKRLNIKKPSGVLLYGPPGCAKTSLAKALATSSNIMFLSVSAADLFSPYVGDAEITITNLFQRARDASPTIIFVDEIDALVGNREEKQKSAQERILSTFLVEMDGIGYKGESRNMESTMESRVIVIGATNRPDSIDSALLRPGRLDRLIYVPPPSLEDRLDILKIITQGMPLSDCVQLQYIAEKTDLFSGADLNSLCQEAALQALTHDGMGAQIIKQHHWLNALKEILPSLTREQIQWYNNFSFS